VGCVLNYTALLVNIPFRWVVLFSGEASCTTDIYSVCGRHSPVRIPPSTNYNRICNNRDMTGASSGAGTSCPPEHHSSSPVSTSCLFKGMGCTLYS